MLAVGLAGCATPADLVDVQGEIVRHQQSLPPDALARPLSVDDAVALAVRYNLDARVKLLEQGVAAGRANLTLFALLPQLTAQGGISHRNPPALFTSQDLVTGTISQNPSLSEDQFRRTGDLAASWNLVDFGLALLRSDQDDDRVTLAIEKRRRAIHLLVQDVQAAYWKAVINEYAENKYATLESKLVSSLAEAERAGSSRVGDPMQMLVHQRAIVETMRQIAELQRQTATARAELAGLMGLPSPTAFQLAAIDDTSAVEADDIDQPIEAMEGFALGHRPEVKGEEAQFKIDVADVHAEMVKSIPGIGPFIGGHYDSNSFMVSNAWMDAGVKVTMNLVDLLSAPQRIGQAKSVAETTRARRLAVAMAVLTQLHVATVQYRHALKEFRLVGQIADIDDRITGLAGLSRQAGSGTRMDEIRTEAAAMLSRLRRFVIYAELRAARGRLNAALGLDPVSASTPDDHADDVADQPG